MWQPSIIAIHNNLLASTNSTLLLFIHRIKWSECFDYCFDSESWLFGKDIILNLSDHTNTYDYQNRKDAADSIIQAAHKGRQS